MTLKIVRFYLADTLPDLRPNELNPVYVDSVFIDGQDADEFSITGNSLGKLPLHEFDLIPSDTIFVDVIFKPNLLKPKLYGNRSVNLVVRSKGNSDRTITLTAHILHAAAYVHPGFIDFGSIRLNSIYTKKISIADVGTANLVIDSVSGVRYPLINVTAKSGDSIHIIDSGYSFMMSASLSSFIDTTITLWICFNTHCAGCVPVTIHIRAAKNDVLPDPSNFEFSIRPNPANGNSIILSLPSDESGEVIIFDMLGRQMLKRNISGMNEIEIQTRNLQNGNYYARLTSNGKILTQKFEVLR